MGKILFHATYKTKDQECFTNLINKIGASSNFSIDVNSGLYDICQTPQYFDRFYCTGKLTVYDISGFALQQQNNVIIDYTDLSCLDPTTFLRDIFLQNWNISDYFFKCTWTMNLLSLNIRNSTINDFPIPIVTQQLYIELLDKIITPVRFSYLISNKTISLEIKPSNYDTSIEIINDFDKNKIIPGFSLPLRRIFSMDNIYTKGSVTIVLTNDFDYNTYQNLSTFGQVSYLYLKGNPKNIHPMIPISILENFTKSSTQYSLTLIEIDYPLEKPNNFINFTEDTQFNHFLLSNVGTQFNINGLLPFKKLPQNLIEFQFNNGLLKSMPDFNLFKNTSVQTLSLQNNGLNGLLPKWDNGNSIIKINLNDNQFTGTIDESWCDVIVNVQNNQMSGTLPNCYTCNINDPNFRSNFVGNSFTNTNQTMCEIIPNLKLNYKAIEFNNIVYYIPTLLFFGENIGYNPFNIIFEPNISYFELVKANSLMSTNQYSPNRIIHKVNFTLTNQIFWLTPDPYPPQLYSIIALNHQLTINGQYFTYNSSVVSISIGNNDCIVKNTTFYQIICQLLIYPPINQSKNISSILKIDQLQTNFRIDLDDGTNQVINNYTSCPNYCSHPNGLCNYNTGICECSLEWYGYNCTTPNQYMSSIIPTDESGGLVQMNGWFGDIHQDLQVLIGDYQCLEISISSRSLNCTIPSGKGTFNVTIIQNGIKWIGINGYTYKSIYQQCLNNCTDLNHGTCNLSTGICSCLSSYTGFDCSTPINNNHPNSSNTNSTINPDGSTTVTNGKTSYNILITSLLELDINGNPIKTYSLQNNWSINNKSLSLSSSSSVDGDDSNDILFSQIINNTNCKIELLIQEIIKDTNYSFADIDFQLNAGSIKVSVSINDYSYSSPLNTLQLQMISNVSSNGNDCNSKSAESTTSINENQLLNYLTINKDNKILFGRFINRAISDNNPTFISTSLISNQNNSITIGINLPHGNNIKIDPDFSVLISKDYNSKCANSRKWVTIIAIVIPVGIALIVSIIYLIYQKKRNLKMIKRVIKLGKLDNSN